MQDVNSFLADWIIKYLDNKDAIKKDIIKIEKNKEGFDFIVHYKDKLKYFIVKKSLDGVIFNKIKEREFFVIVTLNNISNMSFVVNNWEKFVDFKFLSIYFINPFSNLDKVWVINPYIHDKVCDKNSLYQGLKSMSDMVESIDERELQQKIKLKRKEPAR